MKNVTYINAGAGSGKTYRLTETLTTLIKEGKVEPEKVILTTYTTKAANDFKEKAKASLFKQGMYKEAVQLDHAMIGTIHSVCQRMIGKYWFNLGLSPDMSVMAEEDTSYYISQSLADLPTDAELKVLHEFARFYNVPLYVGYSAQGIDYDFWQAHLKSIIGFADNYEIDDFTTSKQKSLEFIRQFVDKNNCNFTYKELDAVVNEHEAFLRGYKQSDANDKRINSLVQSRRSLHRYTLATLANINDTIGTPKGYGPLAKAFKEKMARLWTNQLVYDRQVEYITLLFDLAQRWKENYARFKREKNLLDFNDMEKYMRKLMQDKTIASEISESYHYLFVDEFQDSSPIQAKIFDALSDLMEHSYWVGDYKQAIFGFRGSDTALTKAVVDRIAEKKNGCDTGKPLDKSWRSLPDIVEVNNAIFSKTFAEVLAPQNIHLHTVRTNDEHQDSLRFFVSQDRAGVAEHVLKLLNQGAKPNEIAVLARDNSTLGSVATSLKGWNIPSSREDSPIIQSLIYPLVSSLLRIVDSPSDALSKATVAMLTQSDYSTRRVIEDKLLNDDDASAKPDDYLADVPLVRQLLAIRPRLQQQSVASLVESMIIELNLFDVTKKVEGDPAFGISCLQTIINTARTYEEHSVQMNLPATIDGFIAYIEEVDPKGSGNPDGVQLITYHSSKGLQWKYVILMSLNKNVDDNQKLIQNEIYGVHAVHATKPSDQNPYPDVFIRLTPWVYGAKNVPGDILAIISGTLVFSDARSSMLAENNRIFYVGMTRPRDVLILDIEPPKRGAVLLKWPKDIGVNIVAKDIPQSDVWDVFGTGHLFKAFTLTPDEIGNLQPYGNVQASQFMPLNIDEPSFERQEPRYLSPSLIHDKGTVVADHNFGQRIHFASQPSDMATVGDCIHQIFAGIEEPRPANKIEIDKVIDSYGLKPVLTNVESILQAWKNLTAYLTSTYGAADSTFHERPFRLERDGQTIVGSIDLVWQTAEGDVLVDFKTCPMRPMAVLDPNSEHYAGYYAGQLNAYTAALEAAGEKVIKRFIYYPVSGILVEIAN